MCLRFEAAPVERRPGPHSSALAMQPCTGSGKQYEEHADIDFVAQLRPARFPVRQGGQRSFTPQRSRSPPPLSLQECDELDAASCTSSQLESLSSQPHDASAAGGGGEEDLGRAQLLQAHPLAHMATPERPEGSADLVTVRAGPSTPAGQVRQVASTPAGSAMSDRGLHLLGSPLLSPFAAMPQTYDTPAKAAVAGTPGKGLFTGGSAAVTPIAPSTPADSVAPTDSKCPLTPPLTCSPTSQAPLTPTPATASPPPLPRSKHLSRTGGGGHSSGSHGHTASDSVLMALDFSTPSPDSRGAAARRASAGGSGEGQVCSDAVPVFDPATGVFLGTFTPSPTHTRQALSGLVPLAEVPGASDTLTGTLTGTLSSLDSTAGSAPGPRLQRSGADSTRDTIPPSVHAAVAGGERRAAPAGDRATRPPGTWAARYIHALAPAPAPQRSPRRAPLRPPPPLPSPTTSPLQRNAVRSAWWGGTASGTVDASASTPPHSRQGTASQWGAVTSPAPGSLTLRSPALSPSACYVSARAEARQYGLQGEDVQEYAQRVQTHLPAARLSRGAPPRTVAWADTARSQHTATFRRDDVSGVTRLTCGAASPPASTPSRSIPASPGLSPVARHPDTAAPVARTLQLGGDLSFTTTPAAS